MVKFLIHQPLYFLLKIFVRIALKFFCKNVVASLKPSSNAPTILACNHPNSFLDAIIIASFYDKPVHFLARGDVFTNRTIGSILRRLNLIPIYRLSEGRSYLKNNEQTFDECLRVLKVNGTILVFSEGICRNEWELRPLKKGTARLAYRAWHSAKLSNFCVRPVSVSYSSFTKVPVNVIINEGETINNTQININNPATFFQIFNFRLAGELQKHLVPQEQVELLKKTKKQSKRLVLVFPALIGWAFHKALYNALKKPCKK
jgi:1-acyl-sn-glycerol-3-phosphate acyltransferase